MHTISKIKNYILLLVLNILLLCSTLVKGQNSSIRIQVTVLPPYSSVLSDYISNSNKIMVSLLNTGVQEQEVYLTFKLRSDGGITIESEPGYKSAQSIILPAGMMQTYSISQLSDMFNINRLVTNGIELNELITGAGLPEDYYQICFRAFDYSTNQALSDEDPSGCSNLFQITNLEPPTINNFFCGDEIQESLIQNVTINWSVPSGAFGIEYLVEIKEISLMLDVDANEAFMIPGIQPIYQESQISNTLVLTSDRASLTPGYRYAVRIQAYDPNGKYYFRNDGYSEICNFVYTENEDFSVGMNGEYIDVVVPEDCSIDSILNVTNLKDFYLGWRINNGVPVADNPFKAATEFSSLQEQFPGTKFELNIFSDKKMKNKVISSSTSNFHFQMSGAEANNIFTNDQPYWFSVVLKDTLNGNEVLPQVNCSFLYHYYHEAVTEFIPKTISGKLSYRFENNSAAGSFPIINSKVKIICKTLVTDTLTGDVTIIKEEELNSYPDTIIKPYLKPTIPTPLVSNTSGHTLQNTTNAPGMVSNEEGYFSITFQWPKEYQLGIINHNYTSEYGGISYKGQLSRYIYIKIENPYYANPDFTLSFLNNEQVTDIGEIFTFANSYNLKAIIQEGYKSAETVIKPLVGRKVYILRKNINSSIPPKEGDILSNTITTGTISELIQSGYRVVSCQTTIADKDKEGNDIASVMFPNLIQNLIAGDLYLLWIEATPLNSAESFGYKMPLHDVSVLNNTYNMGFSSFGENHNASNYGNLNNTTSGNSSNSINTNSKRKNNNETLFDGTNPSNLSYTSSGNNAIFTGTSVNTNSAAAQVINNIEDFSSHELIGYENINTNSFNVSAQFTKISTLPPMSGIKGRLTYKFPGNDGITRALANTNISLIACWVTAENPVGKPSKIAKVIGYYADDPKAFAVEVLYTDKTNSNGEFEFNFPNIPLKNNTMSGQFETSTGRLNRNQASWQTWESDKDTKFRVVYSEEYGPLKRTFRIVVEDPNNLYMSPDDDIEIEPLKQKDVGTLTSNVFSYRLKGKTEYTIPSSYNGQYISPQSYAPIEGVECYILRKTSDVNSLNLPEGEGKNMVGSLDELPDYKIISKEISSINTGEFTFENILFRNTSAPILQYFRTPDMKEGANYNPVSIEQNNVNIFAKPVYFFNSDYDYSEITGVNATLEPRPPTIKGKVVSNINMNQGVKGAYCELVVNYHHHSPTRRTYTTIDTTGYFDFSSTFYSIMNWGWLNDIKDATLKVSKHGFHYMQGSEKKPYYEQKILAEELVMGSQRVFDKIILYASGNLTAFVVNEDNQAVESYIQFIPSGYKQGVGEMVKTSSVLKGGFSIPAIPGDHKLAIIPINIAYFADTINVHVTWEPITNLSLITVYERSHRVIVTVKAQNTPGSIAHVLKNARVQLLGDETNPVVLTDEYGKANLKFQNVSVNNLSLKISGPTGSAFIPKIVSFQNEESTTAQSLPTVTLQRGITISGKVLIDGKPTNEAEVIVDLRKGIETTYTVSDDGTSNTESEHYFASRTKSDGTFSLLLPPEVTGKNVEISAAFKPLPSLNTGKNKESSNQKQPSTKTVIGEKKMVHIPSLTPIEFNMQTLNNMLIRDVWGFPLQITSLINNNDGSVNVSGKVNLKGYSQGFDLLSDLSFEVQWVKFVPSGAKENGIPIGEPANEKVIVYSNRSFKLSYAKAFNVKLKTKPDNGMFYIQKNNEQQGKGYLGGLAHIIDNSFQYPGSYLNFDENKLFYLAKSNTGLMGGNEVTFISPVINIFNSAEHGNGNSIKQFNLCNVVNEKQPVAGNLEFKFINFDATSKASMSFIEGDKITLNTTLSANIKNAGEIKVNIGNLVLRNKTIDPVSSETPIRIELKDGGIHNADEAWIFEARNWVVDPQKGGIYSSNCVVHTNKLDIPIQTFNLRSDFAYIGDAICDKITLGGYKIDFDAQAEKVFGYNASTGSDRKGHWELVISPPPSGKVPATVNNLTGMSGVLQLETVSLLSNGEDVFTIGPGATGMRLRNTLDFRPTSLYTLPKGFVLKGAVNFHIPRLDQEKLASLAFESNGGSGYELTVRPINIDFNGKGNVSFVTKLESDKTNPLCQKFDPIARTFTTYGTISEPGKLNPVWVKLTYHDKTNQSAITTTIVQSDEHTTQNIKIGESSTYLDNIACSMNADQTDWDYFKFEGDMQGFKGIAGDAETRMKFQVFGEIKASHTGFKANNISTPFGTLEITYEKNRLLGSLQMDNFPMGSSLVSGSANLLMDKSGWVFYSAAKATNVPAPEPTTINTGILIGDYNSNISSDIQNCVLTYALKKELPSTFTNNGLKGFFMVGGRNLPLQGLDVSINLILVNGHVSVPTSGVDAAYWANFSNGIEFGYSVNGGFDVNFGIGSITCTSLSGHVRTVVGLDNIWKLGDTPQILGHMDMSGNLSVEQGIPFINGCNDAISKHINVSGGFTVGSSFDFYYNFD